MALPEDKHKYHYIIVPAPLEIEPNTVNMSSRTTTI